MQATINGYDILETFGMVITKGMDAFWDWGVAKATVEHSFPEVDGKDKDLPGVKVEAREFPITFTIMANDLADFKAKYWSLRTLVFSPGLKQLYYSDYDETYNIFFSKQQNRTALTKSFNRANIGMQFDIVFSETDPNANIDDVYIVTDDDEYLVA